MARLKAKRKLPRPYYFVKKTKNGFKVFGNAEITMKSHDETFSLETYDLVWKTFSPAQAFAVADFLNKFPEKLELFKKTKTVKLEELLKQCSLDV